MPLSDHHIRERLQRAAWWMSGARALGILSNMLLQIVLARLLTPADFGTFALLTSAIAVTAIVGVLGMNEVSVRYIAGEMAIGGARRANEAARTAFSTAAISIPIAAIAAGLLCYFFGDRLLSNSSSKTAFAGLLAAGGAALAMQQLAADALRGYHELRWASLFTGGVAGGPVCVLTFVILALLFGFGRGLSLRTAATLFVVSILLILPISWSRLVLIMRRRATMDDGAQKVAGASLLHGILHMGATLMLVHLLAFVAHQADLWIGSQWLEREQLALYHASRRMVMLILIPMQVSMVTIASTVAELRAREQHDRLQQLVGSAATVAAVPMLGSLLFLALFAKPILGFVFGEYYQQAVWPLLILITGYSALALCGNPLNVLNVSGGHHSSLIINIFTTVFLLIAAPLGARYFGLNGLAAASAASFALQNMLGWITARRLLGVWTHPSPRAYWRRTG